MDPELTIAQMQGKFRLVLFNNVGHCVQEDDPLAFSKACYSMLYKFKIPISLKELELMHTIGIGKFHPELKPYDNADPATKMK
jgi:protein phosphatase methylesterase 1